MNIIERNYLPKLNIRDTQKAITLIDKLILENIGEKIQFIEVREPIVSSSRIAISTTKAHGNRQINFDSSNDNNIYYIYDDYRYWLVNALKRLDIKNNNAISMKSTYIDRDVEIKNTQSMEKKKLYIEYRYDKADKERVFEKAKELNEIVYSAIRKTQAEINKEFDELKGFKLPEKVDEKELKKIASRQNLENTLADVASEEGAFLLIDKREPLKDKSVTNTFQISLHAFKNEINESYSIYKIQDRRTMQEIESFISESESIMEEYMFGKDVLKDNDIRSISIEIDLDALALLILQKSHILELQSGKSLDEIEKILGEAEIIHL